MNWTLIAFGAVSLAAAIAVHYRATTRALRMVETGLGVVAGLLFVKGTGF